MLRYRLTPVDQRYNVAIFNHVAICPDLYKEAIYSLSFSTRIPSNLLSKRSKSLSSSKIKNSLKDIAEIDAAIKGLSDKSPWQSIRDLALNF